MSNFRDLKDQKFGLLTVIKNVEKPEKHKDKYGTWWLCKCECGNEKIALSGDLVSGKNKSCGCLKSENLIGKRFGRLVVQEKADKNNIIGKVSRGFYWICKCDCGNIKIVQGSNLKRGSTKSCGCLSIEVRKTCGHKNAISLIGERFGRLVVIERSDPPKQVKNGSVYWLCECDCGNRKVINSSSLKNGHSTSCGCLVKEIMGKGYSSGQASFNKILAAYRSSAKRREIEFSLSEEYFKNIITQKCYYCGVGPVQFNKCISNGLFFYNGIDRVDSLKGYTEDNVVPCCWVCNRAKKQMSLCEFNLWIKTLCLYSIEIGRIEL